MSHHLQSRQAEIDRFKTDVDLCALASTLGFAEDRKAGDRNHRVMRHTDGAKLIVGVSKAGHWVFFPLMPVQQARLWTSCAGGQAWIFEVAARDFANGLASPILDRRSRAPSIPRDRNQHQHQPTR